VKKLHLFYITQKISGQENSPATGCKKPPPAPLPKTLIGDSFEEEGRARRFFLSLSPLDAQKEDTGSLYPGAIGVSEREEET
jgi:hypothetical protein